MKTKAIKELHSKNVDELAVLLVTARKELSDFALENQQGKLKNTSSILHKRKEIARIQSILQEKKSK